LKKKDFVVQSIISPAVAEKLIKDKKIIDAWVTRTKGETLALDSDKRQAINPGAELEEIDVEPETPRELPPSSPTMALIELGSDGDELEGFEDDEIDELDGFDLGLDSEENEEIQL
jgi:hypothetical protein